MMYFNNIKIVFVAMAASLPVLYLGFSADASSAYAKYTRRCAEVGFYEKHTRFCDVMHRISSGNHRRDRAMAQETFPPVQTYGDQEVTVYRDHQAGDDGGHVSDKFIALQTAADVQRSSFFGLALGWFPGALDMGTSVAVARAAPVEQRRRIIVTYKPVVTYRKVVTTEQ